MKPDKFIIVLCDGMADEPIAEIGGKTPMEYAYTPTLDEMASYSEIGLVKTTPDNMLPGTDPTNLGLLGYDPFKYYKGRASLEAIGLGIKMGNDDIAVRMNFATVSENDEPYENKRLLDFSAGNIENDDAEILFRDLKHIFLQTSFSPHFGKGFRHILIGNRDAEGGASPAHNIVGEEIATHLPSSLEMRKLMQMSYNVLNEHPINIMRAKMNKPKANSIWLWGDGPATILPPFHAHSGKRSALITGTDALKGIGICAGMDIVKVDGATGTVDTNYTGKAIAAVESLITNGYDFLYLHIAAPDVVSHLGNLEQKVFSIEHIDSDIVKILQHELAKHKIVYRMMVLPDHSTPLRLKTHTNVPVPYMLFDSARKEEIDRPHNILFSESGAQNSGLFFDSGQRLLRHFLNSVDYG